MSWAEELFNKMFYREDDRKGQYDNETEKLLVSDYDSAVLDKNREIERIIKIGVTYPKKVEEILHARAFCEQVAEAEKRKASE